MKWLKASLLGILALAICFFALLHLLSFQSFPITYGVSFSISYAKELALDWKTVYTAMLADLRPPLIRIAAEWNAIEQTPESYDFSDLDWMVEEAERARAQIILVVGQKTPRWPECYIPDWFDPHAPGAKKRFFSYVDMVVARYRDRAMLAAWQVENEPFIHFPFGECEKFQKTWVVEEIERVHAVDSEKPIVVTDSGELGLWWDAARYGDVMGTTVYRFVKTPSGREWGYAWLPAAWYRFRARVLGKGYEEFIISELQAEPWGDLPFPPERFREHLDFARRTGASQAYLWGVEWWYGMKMKGDSRYWEIAKDALASHPR